MSKKDVPTPAKTPVPRRGCDCHNESPCPDRDQSWIRS